jgi:hypothetical protein
MGSLELRLGIQFGRSQLQDIWDVPTNALVREHEHLPFDRSKRKEL